MSDRFDPEAWPYPDDDEPANKASTNKQDDQDDYKSLDFDNPTTAANTQGYGDPYSDAPYSDVNYDDYGYKAPAKTENAANAGYDAPSAGFGGRVAVDDDEGYDTPARHGDDDFGTTGAYGQDDDDADNDPYASRSGSYDEDDPYGSDDYDDDYDEDDEDYDDREPKQGGGLARKLIGAGVVVALAGFAVFMFLTFTGGDDSSDVATAPTTEVTEAPAAESPDGSSPDGSILATQEDAPGEVVDGLNNALTAWGKFAVSGNLDEVRPYFAADGTQFRSFESEATALQGDPPGGAPLTMTMIDSTTLRASDDSWIVQGQVLVTREGEQDQTLNWQIRMENNDGVWQVATVANA